MAVPAHDIRDYAFAKKYNLSIERVLFTDQENERFDELSNELEHLEKQGKDISEAESELQAMVNAPETPMTKDGILFAVSATDSKLAELIDHSSKEARKILAEYAEEK
jgi:leucyl-tRNA synthetase